jgi:ribosomal subunit interface protein
MRVAIRGRHPSVTPALRRSLDGRLRKLERFEAQPARGQFVLVVEKHRHTAEGVVTVNGRTIRGKASTREMCATIDRLLEKICRWRVKKKEKQIERTLRARRASRSREASRERNSAAR